MHRGVGGERVLDLNAQPLALAKPQLGSRHSAAVRPNPGLRIRSAYQGLLGGGCAQGPGIALRGASKSGREARGRGACDEAEEGTPFHLMSVMR
jgi:hypothetical protein